MNYVKFLALCMLVLLPCIMSYPMDAFDSSFRYQPHPLIHIKLRDLLEASNPSSAHYDLGDAAWKKDFVEQQLAMHRNCQRELKGFFEKLLPTIKDPEEYDLIRKDMLSLACKYPLEDTATQISDRFNTVIKYRQGYKNRLNEIIAATEKMK
ncbi:hypothetical protein BH09DEP1_BH09DEP1_0320 [soil metagenome]